MTTLTDRKRLASIRSKLLEFSSQVDTSTWEAAFFLELLDKKNREIRDLKRLLRRHRIVKYPSK